jgi:hypothetical protein
MKTLSIRQPWAWLIVNGFKDIENRVWKTFFRGELLIHAGKIIDDSSFEWIKSVLVDPFIYNRMIHEAKINRGGIVGKATLVDCVQKHESKWFTGPNGFVLKDASPLPFMPCKGKLSFFETEI